MIFVIAGNYEQARQWMNSHIVRRMDAGDLLAERANYRIVGDVGYLRGYTDPSGYFVGTWRERKDIRDIVQTLLVSQRTASPNLLNIWNEIK